MSVLVNPEITRLNFHCEMWIRLSLFCWTLIREWCVWGPMRQGNCSSKRVKRPDTHHTGLAVAIFSLHCFDDFFFLKVGLDQNFQFTVGGDTKGGLIQRRIKGKKEGLWRLTLAWPPPFFHCIVLTSFFSKSWSVFSLHSKSRHKMRPLSMLSFLVVLLLSRPLLRGTQCKAKGCSTVKPC